MNFQIPTAIYFLALAAEIFAQATGNARLQYFSKPSLMLVLIFYFFVNTKKASAVKYLIIGALCFSWLGDVLLLLDKQFKTLFIYGLVAFLTAHLFYIFYFLKIRRLNRVTKLPNFLILIAIAVYTVSLFLFLAPNVKNLLVPVGVYALVISTMLGASFAAFDLGKQIYGRMAVAGTLLFILSDSLLAINKFAAPFEYASVLIMLTYGLAQFFITEASVRNLKPAARPD